MAEWKELPLPAPRRRALFPPNREHQFFQLAAEAPFLAGATDFSWANAWWLAEASLLAYDDVERVHADFARVQFVLPATQPVAAGTTHCYVAVGDDAVIVAFRGTEVIARTSSAGWVRKALNVAGNYLTNAQISPREVSAGVWIHKGFGEALDEVMAPLELLLAQYGPGRKLWLTGHSLGGRWRRSRPRVYPLTVSTLLVRRVLVTPRFRAR